MLGFFFLKFGVDGFYGDELIVVMKKFQNWYGFFLDGIVGVDILLIFVKEVNNLNNLVWEIIWGGKVIVRFKKV